MERESEREGSKSEAPFAIGASDGSGNVRTVFVFLDLPVHYEFRAGFLPLIPERTEIVFEAMKLRGSDPSRTRNVEGAYEVARRVLKYGTTRPGLSGLTQYLEMSFKK